MEMNLKNDIKTIIDQEIKPNIFRIGGKSNELPQSVSTIANNVDPKYKTKIFTDYWESFVKDTERNIPYQEVKYSSAQIIINNYLKNQYT